MPYGVVSSLLAPLPATVVMSKKSTLATNRYMSTDMGIITGANERYKIRGANECLRRGANATSWTGLDREGWGTWGQASGQRMPRMPRFFPLLKQKNAGLLDLTT